MHRRPRFKAFLLQIHVALLTFGLDGIKLLRQLMGLPRYALEYLVFRRQLTATATGWPLAWPTPICTDRAESAGVMQGHYFHMDLWMAQQVVAAKPLRHLDIGSRLDGFVAHLATTMPVTVGDIRPVKSQHANIQFTQLNLMDAATAAQLGTFPSVSCLHTLEHMGLGRYGDPLDASGDVKALHTLAALTAKDGLLYLASPFGRERLEFNAQRVYGLERLLNMVRAAGFEPERFAYVNDAGDLVLEQALSADFISQSKAIGYGCALLICRKTAVALKLPLA